MTSLRKLKRRSLLWTRYMQKIGVFTNGRTRYPRGASAAEGRAIMLMTFRHINNCDRCKAHLRGEDDFNGYAGGHTG